MKEKAKAKHKKLLIIILLILLLNQINICHADNIQTKIIINLNSKKLNLIINDKIYKSYPIGVGMKNNPTPIGSFFKVINKVEFPQWQNPYKSYSGYVIRAGEQNPLGTRWIGFYKYKEGEYGIHGTNKPASVGKASSHGCIRMKNQDVEELFDKIDLGTSVLVTNK